MIERIPQFAAYQRTIDTWLFHHQKDLWKAGVVAAILAASLVIGLSPNILYLLPVIGIGGLLLLNKMPALGMPLIVISALVVPISIGTGTGSSINAPMLMIAALVGLWVMDMYRRKSLRLLNHRVMLPLLGLIVTTIIAFINGQIPWFRIAETASLPAQLGGLMLFVFAVLAFVWVGHVVDLRWLQITTWVFLGVAAIHIFGRVLPIPGSSALVYNMFEWGAISNSMFWTWILALSFSQGLINTKLHPVWRGILLALAASTFYLAFFNMNDWKSGWIPPVVTLGVIITLRWPRLTILMGFLAITPAIGFLGSVIESDLYSYSTRVDAWVILFEIIKVNPLLGLGPSNYYFYTPLFSIRGYYVNFNSHNQYVDIVAQIGLIGLVFYLWFFVAIGIMGWQLLKKVPEGFAKAYVYGGLAGAVAMVVAGALGDWVIPFVYNIGFTGFRGSVLGWIFLGGLFALWRLYNDPDAQDKLESVSG